MYGLERVPAEIREILDRYGFDETRFLRECEAVASGRISKEANLVRGRLQPPGPRAWVDLPGPEEPEAREWAELGRTALAEGKVGAIILNGGMATRFGGVVKGVVEALPGRSFLDLKIAGIAGAAAGAGGKVPIYLMNSFATEEATRLHVAEHRNFGLSEGDLRFYTQGISLRLRKNGEIHFDEAGMPSCYGPGHGDCIPFFRASGHLERFLDGGGRILFLSNVDNLAARLDPIVIGAHLAKGASLTAELAPKWPGDQGGAPVLVDGALWIVEGFRFPPDFDQDSVPVFNTNTFTVDAEALDRDFPLTPCYVEKKVGGAEVVQVETLVGELTRFLPTFYLKVRRTGKLSRFFPIKTPEDLQDGREDLALICAD